MSGGRERERAGWTQITMLPICQAGHTQYQHNTIVAQSWVVTLQSYSMNAQVCLPKYARQLVINWTEWSGVELGGRRMYNLYRALLCTRAGTHPSPGLFILGRHDCLDIWMTRGEGGAGAISGAYFGLVWHPTSPWILISCQQRIIYWETPRKNITFLNGICK